MAFEDVIQLRKVLFEVGSANIRNGCLAGTASLRRAFAVFHVYVLYVLHTLDHFAEGSEALRVEIAAVVVDIDEDLRGAWFGSLGGGENNGTDLVADLWRIVLDLDLAPAG